MVRIPYGKTFIEFDETGASVLTSRIGELKAEGSGADIVKKAMESPIDSPRLSELARGKKTCTIIISDHTRPVPSRDILPNMFAELRQGSPDIAITLLVATGFHRPTSTQELEAKLGQEIMSQVKIVVHDCRNPDSNVQVGVLPSGAPCIIDRVAAEADLLISEGFIEPHFFAGFSGGRKSVLPGISDQVTVLGNHCSRFIDSDFSRTGILDGNPMHEDMIAAAKFAKLAYIVNVVIDESKKTVAAFAGNYVTAHRKGCDFLLSYCQVKPAYADIVITSNGGAPLDQNVYQCVKGMLGKFDLIFCGKESLDGATGQMASQLAERFDASQVTGCLLIDNYDESKNVLTAQRELETGVETVEASLPCLITVEKLNYHARIPNLKGKLAAKKAVITTLTEKDIADLDMYIHLNDLLKEFDRYGQN